MKLISFIKNPFMRDGISVARIRRFATDHLQRMIAYNPGGIFNDRIAVLTLLLDNLSDAFVEDIGHLGIRKASKIVKNKFRKSILAGVERVYGAIVAMYGGDAGIVTEFFPSGRTIFSAAPDDEVIVHLDNLVERVMVHEEDLGADVLEEVTVLRDSWLEIYEASEESTGQKVASEADKREALSAVKRELFYNLNLIAQTYPNQPYKLELYMQQHLLGNPTGLIQDFTGSTSQSTSMSFAGSVGSVGSFGSFGSGSVGSSVSVSSSTSSTSMVVSSNSGSGSGSTAPSMSSNGGGSSFGSTSSTSVSTAPPSSSGS